MGPVAKTAGAWCALWALASSAPWAQAADTSLDNQPLGMRARVEISTHQPGPSTGVVLRLQGQAFQGQTVELTQNGLVFFEQRLSEGPFLIDDLRPFNPISPVSLRLRTPQQADGAIQLPLLPQQKQVLSSQRPELMAPVPVPQAQPPAPKPATDDGEFEFDTDFLRGKAFRNLDRNAVNQLGRARPGNIDVDVVRNDSLVAKTLVNFTAPPGGSGARACITPELFVQLGVKPEHISPAGVQLNQTKADAKPSAPAACLYIDQWVAGAREDYDPSELRLSLTIPQAFLSRRALNSVPPGLLTRGENAGYANYNFNYFQAAQSNSSFLGLNSGINLQGWQVRHTSYLSHSNTEGSGSVQQYVAGETFVRRPLIDWRATLALGEIISTSPIVGSVPVRGLRLSSEEGLMGDDERVFRPVVRGVARSNARVRVLQNNAVFFEQTVPPGPFEFADLNPPAAVGDLRVQVTEADGTVQSFLVPYSLSAGKLKPGSYRYSLSTGNFRNAGNVTETPVLQAFLRYGLDGWPTPGVEWLTTTNYNNMGLQAAFNQAWGTVAFNRLQSQGLGAVPSAGQSYAVNYVAPALGPVNVYAGISGQSLGYLSPITALTNSNADPYNPLSPKNSLFVSLGLNLGQWGAVSLGAVEQNTWTDNTQTHQYRLSYSVYTRAMSLFFSVDQTTYADGRKPLESTSVSASIPLGVGCMRGSVRASHNQFGSMTPTQSLSFNGFHQDSQVGFNLNQSQTGDNSSTSASISRQHAYGNASASYSTSNTGSEQSGMSASGGLVVHRGGLILAPTLGDTFAIVEVPKGEGAGVLGSQARINSRGYGVVPYLSPYFLNDVQISLEGASNELEVDNASQKVAPVEGSIVRLKFSANSGRPLLIVLQASSGARVPIGATVSDAAGNEVGTVGQGSRALVRVQTNKDRLKVVWGDKPEETCWLDYALDEKQTANASGFTNLKLRCEVTGGKEATAQTVPTIK